MWHSGTWLALSYGYFIFHWEDFSCIRGPSSMLFSWHCLLIKTWLLSVSKCTTFLYTSDFESSHGVLYSNYMYCKSTNFCYCFIFYIFTDKINPLPFHVALENALWLLPATAAAYKNALRFWHLLTKFINHQSWINPLN